MSQHARIYVYMYKYIYIFIQELPGRSANEFYFLIVYKVIKWYTLNGGEGGKGDENFFNL